MIRAAALGIAALAVAGCAATTMTAGAPKIVKAHPLPSYQIHEECFTLREGDRVEFYFESDEPLDFNIHYHEGQAVVMPISREKTREYGSVYIAEMTQDYCLMWEAGAAGARIDYRIAIKPAAGS